MGEVWDRTESVEFEVELDTSVAYFPVEVSLATQLRQVAQQRGVSAQTLLNLWVQEKVKQNAAISQ